MVNKGQIMMKLLSTGRVDVELLTKWDDDKRKKTLYELVESISDLLGSSYVVKTSVMSKGSKLRRSSTK